MGDFVQISGYETYGINRNGEIKDLRTGKIKQQYPNFITGGYLQLQLVSPNGTKTERVHRLVAKQFIPNPDPDKLDQIDHIDRCVTNNHVSNLRWVTHSQNQINKLIPKQKNTYKNIWYEEVKKTKNPTASWVININNSLCKYRKRYAAHKYTQEQVYMIRNIIYEKHGIPIID